MKSTYEVTDHPRLVRFVLAGALLVFGAIVAAAAVHGYHYSCCRGSTQDLVAACVGFIMSIVAICWLLSPIRAARNLVQASREGITLSEDDGTLMHVPWSKVGEISVEMFNDAWHLKISADIPEQDRRRLRNRDGGFPRSQEGCVDLRVPVLSKRRGMGAVRSLKAMQQRDPEAPVK